MNNLQEYSNSDLIQNGVKFKEFLEWKNTEYYKNRDRDRSYYEQYKCFRLFGEKL